MWAPVQFAHVNDNVLAGSIGEGDPVRGDGPTAHFQGTYAPAPGMGNENFHVYRGSIGVRSALTGGIANQAPQLVTPLTEYSLQNYFVVPSE